MKHETSTPTAGPSSTCSHRVCPWYLGYLLASPIRRLGGSPERLLSPLVRPGMTVLEPGCGMGFYSLPLARMVGPEGRLVCADLQPKMLEGLRRRARRAGLLDRIETVACEPGNLNVEPWAGAVDLAVAIYMVHEVPDAAGLIRQIHAALRPGGSLLVIEPKGHVTAAQFEATIEAATTAGFTAGPAPVNSRALTVLLTKRGC